MKLNFAVITLFAICLTACSAPNENGGVSVSVIESDTEFDAQTVVESSVNVFEYPDNERTYPAVINTSSVDIEPVVPELQSADDSYAYNVPYQQLEEAYYNYLDTFSEKDIDIIVSNKLSVCHMTKISCTGDAVVVTGEITNNSDELIFSYFEEGMLNGYQCATTSSDGVTDDGSYKDLLIEPHKSMNFLLKLYKPEYNFDVSDIKSATVRFSSYKMNDIRSVDSVYCSVLDDDTDTDYLFDASGIELLNDNGLTVRAIGWGDFNAGWDSGNRVLVYVINKSGSHVKLTFSDENFSTLDDVNSYNNGRLIAAVGVGYVMSTDIYVSADFYDLESKNNDSVIVNSSKVELVFDEGSLTGMPVVDTYY